MMWPRAGEIVVKVFSESRWSNGHFIKRSRTASGDWHCEADGHEITLDEFFRLFTQKNIEP